MTLGKALLELYAPPAGHYRGVDRLCLGLCEFGGAKSSLCKFHQRVLGVRLARLFVQDRGALVSRSRDGLLLVQAGVDCGECIEQGGGLRLVRLGDRARWGRCLSRFGGRAGWRRCFSGLGGRGSWGWGLSRFGSRGQCLGRFGVARAGGHPADERQCEQGNGNRFAHDGSLSVGGRIVSHFRTREQVAASPETATQSRGLLVPVEGAAA